MVDRGHGAVCGARGAGWRGRLIRALSAMSVVLALVLPNAGCREGGESRPRGGTDWARGRTLTVAGYTKAHGETSHLFVGRLVERLTGAKVRFVEGNSRSHHEAMREAGGGRPPFDLAYLTGMVRNRAHEEGLLEEIRPDEIPFWKDLENNARADGTRGPGVQFYTVGLLCNKDGLAALGVDGPRRWADLWKVEALRGKVAVPDLVHTAGKDFLIAATRVAGADPGTVEGLGKGIEAIRALKPALVYRSMSDLSAAIESGTVLAAPCYNDQAYEYAVGLNLEFVIPEERGFVHVTSLVIPRGTPNRDLAIAYVTAALSPAAQIAGAISKAGGPANEKVYAILAGHPSLTRRFPLGSEDFDRLVVPDWTAIHAGGQELEKAWNEAFGKDR